MIDFTSLQSTLLTLDHHFKIEAGKSVNRLLTMRNWLFGFYIVEFEQHGADRAAYGDKLLEKLSSVLGKRNYSVTNLKLFRQFYLTYPQFKEIALRLLMSDQIWQSPVAKTQFFDNQPVEIWQSLVAKSLMPIENQEDGIGQTMADQLQPAENQPDRIGQPVADQSLLPIVQPVAAQLGAPPEKVLSHLSFSHISLLLTLDTPLQRAFYEIECLRGAWSKRELKRQIGTLLFERTGLSNDKDELLRRVHQQAESLQPADFIRSPYLFEFLGLPDRLLADESKFEQALIDHLQAFLLELGSGFCFEARQKRILIGDDWHFIDLVFYHRILKCHVLVDLKTTTFKPAFAGNMNAYLNCFREEVKRPEDKPPVGLILCAGKNEAAVRYALGGLDEQVFVSQYKILLPDEVTLKAFIERERDLLA